MTMNVTSFNTSVNEETITKMFKFFASNYGSSWLARCSTPSDWYECRKVWLDALKDFDLQTLRSAAKEAIKNHMEFPPTLGQFVALCMAESGLPSIDDVISKMNARDFSHPLVMLVYGKMDTWFLSHAKREEVKAKVKPIFNSCVDLFKVNPDLFWEQMKAFNNTRSLPAPEKIPSQKELKTFREHLSEWKEKARLEKIEMGERSHPTWPIGSVTIGHRDFDQKLFDERKEYLISIDEQVAGTLQGQDWYDRMRYMRQKQAKDHLSHVGYTDGTKGVEKTPPRSSNASKVIYKNWFTP